MMQSQKHPARLLVQGLTDSDIEQVKTVLKNSHHRTHNDWRLVNQGDAELALIGPGEPSTILGMFDEPMLTLQVLESGSNCSGPYGILTTPLRYTTLADLVIDIDRRLAFLRAKKQAARSTIAVSSIPAMAKNTVNPIPVQFVDNSATDNYNPSRLSERLWRELGLLRE